MDEIYIPLFIYKEAKEKYKYNANFIYKLKRNKTLMEEDLKNNVIEIERIGSKYITIRHYDRYMFNICPSMGKSKIQIKKGYFYNKYAKLGEDINIDVEKLKLNKPYSISRIETKVPLTKKYDDERNIFAVINLKPIFNPTAIISNCSVCFEDNQFADEKGYFKCSHKECICHNCFDLLPNKICPLCRSI